MKAIWYFLSWDYVGGWTQSGPLGASEVDFAFVHAVPYRKECTN